MPLLFGSPLLHYIDRPDAVDVTTKHSGVGHTFTAAPVITAGAPDRTVMASDLNQVRALYAQLMDGWNRGSGEAFAAPFMSDGDLIGFDGVRFHGRDEIVRFHDPLFKTHLKGTRLVGEVTDVRFLGSDVAVMHARGGTLHRGQRQPAPERDSIQTLVAARDDDGEWRLVAFQNTRVRPMGRTVLGTLLWIVTDRLWRWCLPRRECADRPS